MQRFVAALVLALMATGIGNAQTDKPNIIFILVDDQRYDALGFLNPVLETPNMDRLAQEGAFFENAFVTTSLCSPSRATILTGQYMHDHGIVDNNTPLKDDAILFPEYLQDAGYDTALIGKWHMGGDSDAPQPGFNHWVSFAGQGNYFPIEGQPLNVNGEHVPQQGYITDELTEYALDWLNTREEQDKPFFLYLSHKAVHAQFIPAPRHTELYSDIEIPLPAAATEKPEDTSGIPLWVQNQRNSWHGVDYPYHNADFALSEFLRSYYRTLAAVDDSIGTLLSHLEDEGILDNTVVILMGDNGFLFGEHGLIDKRNGYEESTRVPLLMRAPMLFEPGTVVPNVVANLDIAPTALDLAGVDKPSQFAGRSLVDLTREDSAAWRTELLYEYYWEYNYPHTPTVFSVRGDRYKLIQYHGVWDREELFDLVEDPNETNNLIDDPELLEVKLELRDKLFDLLRNANGEHVIPYTQKRHSGAVFRYEDGSRAAEYPDDWYRPSLGPEAYQHFIPDGPNKQAELDKFIADREEQLAKREGGDAESESD